MIKKLFFLLIVSCLGGLAQAKTLDLNTGVSVKDTGKTKSEEAAAERYQPFATAPSKRTRPQPKQLSSQKKPSRQIHYGKRLRKMTEYLKAKDTPVMVWAALIILAGSLLVGVGMILEIVSFLGAFIALSILTLAALVLPFINDIGIGDSFALAAMMFFFGVALIYLTLAVLGAWAGGAALAATGAWVLLWTLLSLAFAIAFYFALYIIWKVFKAVFRIFILVLTLGFVDIGD